MRGLLVGFGLVLLCVGVIAVVTSLPEDGTESGRSPVPMGEVEGQIEIRDRQYRPQRTTAIAGTTVSVINRDSEPHGVRFEQRGIKDLDRIDAGQSETLEPPEPGTYDFVCPFHPEMRGTLVVQEGAGG